MKAIARQCGIHIWQDTEKRRYKYNPYAEQFYRYLSIKWVQGKVPGSFFGSDLFTYFTQILDEWALADPGQLEYFGGQSLASLSHGQSLMAFFRARYQIRGIYFMDEPETALSPKTQLELLDYLEELSTAGHAQFIIATHSPILLACKGASILSFDNGPLHSISYQETEHFRIYRQFIEEQSALLGQ